MKPTLFIQGLLSTQPMIQQLRISSVLALIVSGLLLSGCTPESTARPEERVKEVLASSGLDPSDYEDLLPPTQVADGEETPEVVCAVDEVWDGEACMKRNPGCKQYQEVTQTNGTFVVPARTSAEVCFYIKVFDAVAFGPSQTSRAVRTDVKSRDHSDGMDSHSMNHPLVLGQRAVDVQLAGARNVMLAADKFATQNIRVDNFVLVEIMRANLQKIVWGAGSEDVRFYDENNNYGLKLNDVPVAYEVHAPGGTSEFQPVEFTNFVPLQEPISISISALDCRGSEESTDGYLIFR